MANVEANKAGSKEKQRFSAVLLSYTTTAVLDQLLPLVCKENLLPAPPIHFLVPQGKSCKEETAGAQIQHLGQGPLAQQTSQLSVKTGK